LKTWGGLEKPRKGEPCINFLVEDLDEAYNRLLEKGVKIIDGPKNTLWVAVSLPLWIPMETHYN